MTIESELGQDTSTFIVSITYYFDGALQYMHPRGYVEIDSIPVLLVSPTEPELKLDSASLKSISERLAWLSQPPPNYNPIVWRVKMRSGKIVRREVLN